MNDTNSDPLDPKHWKKAEHKRIAERRCRAHGFKEPASGPPENVTGLSLSGGGIRSALFNDGFLQGLSHRGLLRFVDYLCSVSGGGYIAGSLIAQRAPQTSEGSYVETPGFHDDRPRWSLGRDPKTGEANETRLAGIGGYLSRPFEFIPAYLWSFFFSFAFYCGAMGIVATLAAMFWRTFDGELFRTMYVNVLGLHVFGDELLIAFIPALMLLAIAVGFEGVMFGYRILGLPNQFKARRFHTRFRAVMLLLLAFSLLTSVAVFIGNGKSFVGDQEGTLYLNKYAQLFAIAAALTQVFVFLGRDRLFRSERGEAKHWQRMLNQSVTTVVIVIVVFSMVHWMSREDISQYVETRDSQLVHGDVLDWDLLDSVVMRYESERKLASRKTDDLEFTPPAELLPKERWGRHLSVHRVWRYDSIRAGDLSFPPIAQEPVTGSSLNASYEHLQKVEVDIANQLNSVWPLHRRIYAAVCAYVIQQRGVDTQPADSGENDSTWQVMAGLSRKFRRVQAARAEFLWMVNGYLDRRDFTEFIVDNLSSSEQDLALGDQVRQLIDVNEASLTEAERERLMSSLRSLELPTSEATGFMDVNRILIELLFPTMVQPKNDTSTWVVPALDQRTRTRYLVFWMLLTLLGIVGEYGTYRVPAVFRFYRKQLAQNFLVRTRPSPKSDGGSLSDEEHGAGKKHRSDEKHRSGNGYVSELRTERDGLPYPLILAASLEPATCNGSYYVRARPFLFSPLFSGDFDHHETMVATDDLSHVRLSPRLRMFKRRKVKEARRIKLDDAVTLSGAAVTPLMSGNRWLSVILDFFNTGIGLWIRHGENQEESVWSRCRGLVLIFVLALLVSLAGWWVLGLQVSTFLVFAVTFFLCLSVKFKIGSPGLIRTILLTRESEAESSTSKSGSQSGGKPSKASTVYVADGGYHDYLGVSELLRRKCELIIVSDAGANVGKDSLGTLARMCEKASREMGIRFLDLDHEAPIDFGRLEMDEQRLVHQPFICVRVRYPEATNAEALLIYCQMSITDTDPIEIQNIRNLFPSFPDEPTVNQFYNDKQVMAYRALGYHVANRVCSELERWKPTESDTSDRRQEASSNSSASGGGSEPPAQDRSQSMDAGTRRSTRLNRFRRRLNSTNECRHASQNEPPPRPRGPLSKSNGQPLFDVLKARLLTSYRLACYEEKSYRVGDIYSEAIWPSPVFAFPTFGRELGDFPNWMNHENRCAQRWLCRYEDNADVRSAYRTAVIEDINTLGVTNESFCGVLWNALFEGVRDRASQGQHIDRVQLLASHLTCIAVAGQEVHRGRPHSVFQVGGRDKLIDLCVSVADVILHTASGQSTKYSCIKIKQDMDQIIGELIELERSVFQGAEHVSTITFAQCVATAWGLIARSELTDSDDIIVRMKAERTFFDDGPLSELPVDDRVSARSPEIAIAQIRDQLDRGLSKMDLPLVRIALAKCWYLGFLSEDESVAMIKDDVSASEQELEDQAKSPQDRSSA